MNNEYNRNIYINYAYEIKWLLSSEKKIINERRKETGVHVSIIQA